MSTITIQNAIENYSKNVASELSPSTARVYISALRFFTESLKHREILLTSGLERLSTKWISHFAEDIKAKSKATQRLYLMGVIQWYKFVAREYSQTVDLDYLYSFLPPSEKRNVANLPNINDVHRLIEYMLDDVNTPTKDTKSRLRWLRDRAFILTLTDSGLDINLVCKLQKNDINWTKGKAIIDGKHTITLSRRTIKALREYLEARLPLDNLTKRKSSSLPLFARHDKGVGNRVLSISTATARNIISERVAQVFDEGFVDLSPISLRLYSSLLAQNSLEFLHPKILERCQTLFDSEHYDDAIFAAMKTVEDELRSRTSLKPTDIGSDLITKIFKSDPPLLVYSQVNAEQEAAYFLFRGAIGVFKNPLSHRFLETTDPNKTFECLALASLLLRMLDEMA